MKTKTHFKKNNDSRYISGEDLKDGVTINKGLKPEMIVELTGFHDVDVFDRAEGNEVKKTGLYMKEVGGLALYKPAVLNGKAIDFFRKETNSDFMEDWVGVKAILYAMPDKRFGHVARFKKHYEKIVVDVAGCEAKLGAAKTGEDLKNIWVSLSDNELKEILKG